MQKSLFSILVFVSLCSFSVAYATGYNYLPDDVYIKQQQEKSALEYRLKNLESQISGSPQISILTIDQRIDELRQEWETKKEYTRDMLAHNGAYTPESYSSLVAKFETEYSSQINSLEAQKSQYQQQINNQAKIDEEIAKIQQQIKEIDAYYDKQRDAVIQKYQQDTTPQKQATIGDLYEWLETLPADEWTEKINLLKVSNPTNYLKIVELYRIYHPEFFTQNEEPKATPTITPKIAPLQKTAPKKVEQETKSFDVETIQTVKATSTPVITPTQETKQPEKPRQSFVQKVFGFFRSLMFWR